MNRIAEGREAEVFLGDDGRVLKLFRLAEYGDRADGEATALRTLAAAGIGAPAVYERVEVDGRPGLLMERVQGADLLTVLGAKPWLVWRAGRTLGAVHAAMHEVVAPDSLPALNDALRGRIERGVDGGVLDSRLADFALGVLSALPQGDRLCHGDLHVGNLLGTWDEPVVIDWGDASRGDPMSDYSRTVLLHRIGELPPGMPRLLRTLAKIGRGRLVASYRRAYGKVRAVDEAAVARWNVVRAAARFVEGIEGEYDALTRFLEKARGRAA